MNGTRRGQIRWGESVVVYGAGLIGQHVARYARLAGALPVLVVDTSEERLKKLPNDPCIIPVNSLHEDPLKIVEANTYKGRMADIVYETTGNSDVIPMEILVLRKQGRMVIVSSPRGKTVFDFNDLCSIGSRTIIGSHNGSHPTHETLDNPWTLERDIAFHFSLVTNKLYDPLPMITHRFPSTSATDAYKLLIEDRTRALAVHLSWVGI